MNLEVLHVRIQTFFQGTWGMNVLAKERVVPKHIFLKIILLLEFNECCFPPPPFLLDLSLCYNWRINDLWMNVEWMHLGLCPNTKVDYSANLISFFLDRKVIIHPISDEFRSRSHFITKIKKKLVHLFHENIERY